MIMSSKELWFPESSRSAILAGSEVKHLSLCGVRASLQRPSIKWQILLCCSKYTSFCIPSSVTARSQKFLHTLQRRPLLQMGPDGTIRAHIHEHDVVLVALSALQLLLSMHFKPNGLKAPLTLSMQRSLLLFQTVTALRHEC